MRGVGNPVDERAGAVGPVLGDVPVNGLHDDHRAIDNDSEIHGPDGKQVCRLSLYIKDRDCVEQGQRDDQGDDGGTRQVTKEDEEHSDDQADADEQVVEHVVRRDVDEVCALIEDGELHPPGQNLLVLDLCHLFGDRLGGRQGFLVFPHEHDAFDDVVLIAAADDALAGLVSDNDLGDLPDIDGRAVGCRGDHHVADVIELFCLDESGL